MKNSGLLCFNRPPYKGLQPFLLTALTFLFSHIAQAQSSFRFNCPKDTVVAGCSASCITLQATIPNLHAETTSYTVEKNNCFTPYIAPDNASGTVVTLADDRYSGIINIGFPFSFYGATYNQLVFSTNGYISFDVSKAGARSHFGILSGLVFGVQSLKTANGTPENLPSTLYDKALIMGPYHDLNPTFTTSPNRRIQYQVVGTAPYRKWILSFYKLPLHNASCSDDIENTSQIVLHESTGMIEVFVFDRQVCTAWNEGRAMIGLQNYDRNQAIMAPGRQASDAPWGTPNMNESWRFIPAGGSPLLKRAELYDMAGHLISTGTTADAGNDKLQASFANVCTTAPATGYVVKSVYQKIDNAALEVYGTDTVNILKTPSNLSATTTATPTFCDNTSGSVNVSVAAGTGTAPYQFALNGGPFQTTNVFTNLPKGSHTITVKDAGGCTYNTTATVPLQNNAVVKTTPDTSICVGTSFTAQTFSNAHSFSWAPAGGVSNSSVQNPVLKPTITTTYTVTATYGECTVKDSVRVSVIGLPKVAAGAPVRILEGDAVQLAPTASPGDYLWTPASGLSAANVLAPLASPAQTTTYTLTVTNGTGCTASDMVTVTVEPYCVKPMDAFTPNGDGINDVWRITDGGCVQNAKVQVYNRYGALVFESVDYKNNWNGTYNGKPLPDGTYYFIISYYFINGKTASKRGNVTILH